MWLLQFCLLLLLLTLDSSVGAIKGPPSVDHSGTEMKRIVRLGSNFRLHCPMSGHPQPFIDWTKDGVDITNYGWIRFKASKKSLRIAKVETEDTGVYRCKGTNGFGSKEIRIDLIVIDPADYPGLGEKELPEVARPVFTEETLSLRSAHRQKSGQNFRLVCEALGKPDPKIVWYKNGQEMAFSSSSSSSSSSSRYGNDDDGRAVLTVKNVQTSNTGMYTCKASNAAGAATRNFTLEVIPDRKDGDGGDGDPSLRVDAIDAAGGFLEKISTHDGSLTMSSGPENTTVDQGDRAVLECRVLSPIRSKITWLKQMERADGERDGDAEDVIEIGPDKFKVLQQDESGGIFNTMVAAGEDGVEYMNKIVIEDAKLDDAGVYFCFVKNVAGYKFRKAYLTVVPNLGMPTGSLLVLVICLSLAFVVLVVTVAICVLKRKQEQQNKASNSSNTTSSNGSSEVPPELTENLMCNQGLPQTTNPYAQQQMMHRNMMQQQQQQHQSSHYHQPYHHSNPYQLQQQYATNNNHRLNHHHHHARNGHQASSMMANKLAEPHLPPAPQPPIGQGDWMQSQGMGGYGIIRGEASNGRLSGTLASNNNPYSRYMDGQQNQYEVPHVTPRDGLPNPTGVSTSRMYY